MFFVWSGRVAQVNNVQIKCSDIIFDAMKLNKMS